jgi:hypothetical protein
MNMNIHLTLYSWSSRDTTRIDWAQALEYSFPASFSTDISCIFVTQKCLQNSSKETDENNGERNAPINKHRSAVSEANIGLALCFLLHFCITPACTCYM